MVEKRLVVELVADEDSTIGGGAKMMQQNHNLFWVECTVPLKLIFTNFQYWERCIIPLVLAGAELPNIFVKKI